MLRAGDIAVDGPRIWVTWEDDGTTWVECIMEGSQREIECLSLLDPSRIIYRKSGQ